MPQRAGRLPWWRAARRLRQVPPLVRTLSLPKGQAAVTLNLPKSPAVLWNCRTLVNRVRQSSRRWQECVRTFLSKVERLWFTESRKIPLPFTSLTSRGVLWPKALLQKIAPSLFPVQEPTSCASVTKPTALSCGNVKRNSLDSEKEVLRWGASFAIAFRLIFSPLNKCFARRSVSG